MCNDKQFSFSKGYSFQFLEGEYQIQAWFSSFSGREKVFVNGNLVANQRNYSADSTNSFVVNENSYATNLYVGNLFKGPFTCTLYKNGEPYKRQKLIFPRAKGGALANLFDFAIFLFLGISYGFAYSYFELPSYSLFIFMIAIIFLSFSSKIPGNQKTNPIIENENI